MSQPLCLLVRILLIAPLAGCLNFHVVEEGRVYRSAQPSEERATALIEEHGIKTLLFLRKSDPGDPAYEASYQAANAAGATFIRFPMSAHRYPSQEQLLGLWEIFATAEYPILLHCRGGADRSGLASAIYLLQQHDDIDLALGELSIWPYMHTGLLGAFKLDLVFEFYRPFVGRISFPRWVKDHYNPLDHDFQVDALRASIGK